jgi:hypothetical protein
MKNNSIFNSYYLVVCGLLLNGILSAQPHSHYVSSSGNDLNSGSKITEPLQTITKAISIASAGDTVFVLPGLYKNLIEIKNKNGVPEKPIVIISYHSNPEKIPVIDGGAVSPGSDLNFDWIHVSNSSWIEIVKMKFQNGWTNPITISNSSFLSFKQCEFLGGKRVINVTGPLAHHILVEECSWDQGGEFLWKLVKDKKGIDAWTSMHHGDMSYFNGSLIDFSGSGGSIVIRKNKIISAFNALRWRGQERFDTNIEIYDNDITRVRDNDFEPEYYTYNLHIYHNHSHNVHRTLSIDNVNGGKVFYYGNIITTENDEWTKKVCTGFWKIYGEERNLALPIYAFNNSFYGVGRALRTEQYMIRFNHFNNAYYFTRDTSWLLNKWDESNTFDYDISNTGWPELFTLHEQEKHGKGVDVKYRNAGNGNLRLQKDSPGIDAGTVIHFDEFDWTQKYSGKAPDVGAFEGEELVDGPAFRFILPEGVKTEYNENPRIVKSIVDKNKFLLYFSSEIDPTTVDKGFVHLYLKDQELKITSMSFPRDNYEMELVANKTIKKDEVSISFEKFPKGKNGELATGWASSVKIHKH